MTPVSFERTGWPGQPQLWDMRRLERARHRAWIGTRLARPRETIGGPGRAEPLTGDWQQKLRVPVVLKVRSQRGQDERLTKHQRGVLPGQDDFNRPASGDQGEACLDLGFLQVTSTAPRAGIRERHVLTWASYRCPQG